MPHISLPEGLPGITSGFAFRPETARPMRELKAYQRQAVLQHCVRRFSERAEELAESLCVEAG